MILNPIDNYVNRREGAKSHLNIGLLGTTLCTPFSCDTTVFPFFKRTIRLTRYSLGYVSNSILYFNERFDPLKCMHVICMLYHTYILLIERLSVQRPTTAVRRIDTFHMFLYLITYYQYTLLYKKLFFIMILFSARLLP